MGSYHISPRIYVNLNIVFIPFYRWDIVFLSSTHLILHKILLSMHFNCLIMTSTYLNFPKRQNYSNSNHSDDEFRFAGENISSIPTNRHDNGPNIISENLPNDVRVERKKKVEWKCQAVGVQFVQYQWMKDFKVRQKIPYFFQYTHFL